MGMFNPPQATGRKILFKNPEAALRPENSVLSEALRNREEVRIGGFTTTRLAIVQTETCSMQKTAQKVRSLDLDISPIVCGA
jgi:hypothetical protein